MKNIFRSILLVFVCSGAFAQQLPFTSQYMFNDYLINPAVGGSTDYTPIALSIRSQWAGLENSPNTQFFSAHTKWGRKIGVGGYVFNDETGPINERGAQISYSYHLRLNNDAKISLGLGGMFFSHSISTAKLKFDQPDDVALSNIQQNSISPDASFGVLYYTKKYKVGISIPQIFQSNLYDNIGTNSENKLIRHYFLHGEYSFKINDNFDIVPSTLVKLVSGAPIQYDINAKGVYQKKYWAGVSYRHGDAIVAMIGLQYNQFQLGYSYDYTLSDIRAYSSGTHEIYLALILGEQKQTSSAKFQ